MKYFLLVIIVHCNCLIMAQLSGSIESNSAIYVDDAKIKLDPLEASNRFRSNNYFRLDYSAKKFSAGLQAEAYQTKALLNYSPQLKNEGLAAFYLNYKNDSAGLDITAGHFFEEFGSGLALRTWEDRQLGIANSIFGARIKYQPVKSISFTTLYGRQRNGLNLNGTDGKIFAVNSDIDLASLFGIKKILLGAGGSFVNRKTDDDLAGLPSSVYITSARANLKTKKFSVDIEYAFKSKDALVEFGNVRPEFLFDGDAYLLNISYSNNGLGISSSFRRLENFSFYSQRNLERNVLTKECSIMCHHLPGIIIIASTIFTFTPHNPVLVLTPAETKLAKLVAR